MIFPIKDRVAVSPIYDSDRSSSGLLVIPDEAKERCDQGIVKYIGPDVSENIAVGDHVSFSGYTGTTVRIGSGHGDYESDEILIIVPEPFIVCKILDAVTACPGLYFKRSTEGMIDVVGRIVYKITELLNITDERAEEIMSIIIDELRDSELYFEATHEKVIEHIAWLLTTDIKHREKFGFTNRAAFKPKRSEYAGLR